MVLAVTIATECAAAVSNPECSWLRVATGGAVATFRKNEPMPFFLPLTISCGFAAAAAAVLHEMLSWSSFHALRPPITLIAEGEHPSALRVLSGCQEAVKCCSEKNIKSKL